MGGGFSQAPLEKAQVPQTESQKETWCYLFQVDRRDMLSAKRTPWDDKETQPLAGGLLDLMCVREIFPI